MHRADATRLRHMIDAARDAASFVAGRDRAELDRNRMLSLALLKEIEIVGEAAGRVSEDCRTACGEVLRANIIAVRNRLIHGCHSIDLDIVWSTATVELPRLIPAPEKCLSSHTVE